MEKKYFKLVRDLIPEIISKDGRTPITRVLTDDEYKIALKEKLKEEYEEVLEAQDKEELAEELADMLEVIEALALFSGKSMADILAIKENKKEKRGGFEDKILLEKVIE